VTLDKKYQRADWSLRPLTAPMIAYAADDTRHLPALRDRLAGQLEARGRLAWAEEEFGHLESVRWSGADRDADAYLRLKGARLLRGRSLAVLRSLHAWREATARELDAAPFRVLGNEALIALARAVPLQLSSLPGPPELPAALARRYGAAVIAVIREAAEAPEATWPRLERGPRETQDPAVERRLERLKALRNARARELAIDAGVLCPNGTLQAVAERSPATADQLAAIPELRRWQRIALGESKILETLKDPPAGPP